jgi:drug/metabolite transporter (DMT)-like permease
MLVKHLYFVSSAFLLGLGAVLSKLLFSPVIADDVTPNPISILTVQLLAGVASLVVIRLATGWQREGFARLKRPAMAGFVLGVGSIGTIFAISMISASEASLVFATQPIVMLGLAWLLLAERIDTRVIILCGIAVSGVILTIVGGQSLANPGRSLGFAFAIFSTCCAALYTVWMRGLSANQDALTAIIVVQSISFLLALLATAVAQLLLNMDWSVGGPFALFFTMVSGVVQYGAAYYLYVLGLKTTPASTAGIYLCLVPVFTIGLAFVIVGETLRPLQWIGAIIVIAAVMAVFASEKQ